MLNYPNIDPVALSIGPLAIHWYGLMYLLGLGGAWLLGNYRAKQPNSGWNSEQVSDLVFFAAVGLILGGRIGYMLFYNFGSLAENPLNLLRIWEGGMSFHGGLIGVAVATYLFCRKHNIVFLNMLDTLALGTPIGLFFGRIANFINQEHFGEVTTLPWAVRFPYGNYLPRHPSQLYEAALEGVLLFLIMNFAFSRNHLLQNKKGMIGGGFICFYGLFRFLVEFVRIPDGYLCLFTLGQAYSIPMILLGIYLMKYRQYKGGNFAPTL